MIDTRPLAPRYRNLIRIGQALGHNRGGTLTLSPGTHRALALVHTESGSYLFDARVEVDPTMPDGIVIHRLSGEAIGQTILID